MPRDADRNYVIVRGPDADRHVKLLIQFAVEGSLSGAYSQPNGFWPLDLGGALGVPVTRGIQTKLRW